jgi:hypothetical protein
LYQLSDAQTNNMMLQQTTNSNPSASMGDMYHNACGMMATQLMQSGSIQNNVELWSAVQNLLIPRAHQPIVAGRHDCMTLAEHRQQKKNNIAIQKQQKASAHGQQQLGKTGRKQVPPPMSSVGTTTATTTPVTTATTPATAAATSSTTSTFASGRWSDTGSNFSVTANNFVGAGSNNSRVHRGRLSMTTYTPDPFNVTASLFVKQQDHDVGGGFGRQIPAPPHEPPPTVGGQSTLHELPPTAAVVAPGVTAAIADVVITP